MKKTEDTLITIIIPTYNYGRYIRDAIDSALAQTYPHTEIIIVDDGSTDNTPEVVEPYITTGKIRYFKIKNGGVSNARNFGIHCARGTYVIFLDADDKLTKNYIRKTLTLMSAQDTNVGYIYTQLQYFEASNYTTQYPGFKLDYLVTSNFINACSLIRTDVVKQYPYDTGLAVWEDWDFYLTLAENGITGLLLNEPLVLYRKHTDGKSTLDTFTEKKKLYSAHRLRCKHWKLYGYVETVRHWIWYIYVNIRSYNRKA